MRILIANTPLMYRETSTLAVHRHNPNFEVMMVDPNSMDGEAERFRPHALVRDDDGTELASPDGVVCWVGAVIIDDHLKARIGLEGKVSEVTPSTEPARDAGRIPSQGAVLRRAERVRIGGGPVGTGCANRRPRENGQSARKDPIL